MQHSVAEVVALVMYDEAGVRRTGAGRCLHGMHAAVEAIGHYVALCEKRIMGSSELCSTASHKRLQPAAIEKTEEMAQMP